MRASRFVPSRPPVVPYSGPMEPDEPGEPKEPMPLKARLQQFLDKVVFSNLLGCGVEYDKDVSVIKVAQVPVAF